MLCDECHKNEAMINLKLILDGEIIEKHLCTECALKDFNEMNQGEYGEYTDMNINESDIRSLFEGLQKLFGSFETYEFEEKECPNCHMKFSDFNKNRTLGCEECYKTFAYEIRPILNSLRGEKTYEGLLPKRYMDANPMHMEIVSLKKELEAAIQDENYERAAELRDEIKAKSTKEKLEDGEINDNLQ